jgi:hypothetical protein
MPTLNSFRQVIQVTQVVTILSAQVMRWIKLRLRSRMALAAESLFLKKQLALYQEHNARWRCDLNVTRLTLVWLSYCFDWQPALTLVQPATFKRWRRQGWRLLWKTPAKPGRPPIPPGLQALIRRMARENVTWGQKRIANELSLKLGLRVSPRTVRKYTPSDCVGSPGRRCPSQRWSTFIRNHAKGLVFTGVTAEVARKAQAMLARIRRLSQNLRNWALQRASSPIKTRHQPVMICIDDACGIPGAAVLNRAEPMMRVERSPPEKWLSRHAELVRVVESRLAAKVEVRSLIPVRFRRVLVRPTRQSVASALSVVRPSDSLPQVA